MQTTSGFDFAKFQAMSPSEQQAYLAQLHEKAKAGEKATEKGVTFKVSEKGAVSAYGLGKFPVTLYAEQWEKLMEAKTIEALHAFIKSNPVGLKRLTEEEKKARAEARKAEREEQKAKAEQEKKNALIADEAKRQQANGVNVINPR